eukprot:CAMPEP_0177255634 /NCGR_PEP_ID=MMETSP0367-20130122/56473_1 /TAXON_ID=447022 ORGANISM="Scrippsiella hangoei-like, Strain SHHI-4" /NCGR_SAMPLE_ID=MMETSP0367 /ASSEMBLY_ACC=CAM_ASM_000362 /LENGTH=129 /DNA_ID=CAMNT_0018709385 /DNA_START=88 /DNA_END=475 /DNA_ORIENTATION=-
MSALGRCCSGTCRGGSCSSGGGALPVGAAVQVGAFAVRFCGWHTAVALGSCCELLSKVWRHQQLQRGLVPVILRLGMQAIGPRAEEGFFHAAAHRAPKIQPPSSHRHQVQPRKQQQAAEAEAYAEARGE